MYLPLCCLQLHIPYVLTHTLTYSVALRSHLSYAQIQSFISGETGNTRLIFSIFLSCSDLQNRAHFSPCTVHPLISHHFTQLSASTSLFLLITRNNPPKSLSGSVFPNSQTRNTMAAQPLVQTSRDQSVWWMHTHLWEISSVDKMNTYWFLVVFFFFRHFPPLLWVKYVNKYVSLVLWVS